MNEFTQRIQDIMQDKKMTATQFSDAIGIQRATMSHIISGRNNPSLDVISKIANQFEDINPNWLISGKGAMKILPGHQDKEMTDTTYPVSNRKEPPENVKKASDRDLFRPNVFGEEPIRTEVRPLSEIRAGDGVNQSENTDKIIEKEVVIYKERPHKTIEKLFIFYSDRTYETFLPEKTDPEQ